MKFGFMKFISPESKSQFLLKRIESENIFLHFPPAEINAIKEDLQNLQIPALSTTNARVNNLLTKQE